MPIKVITKIEIKKWQFEYNYIMEYDKLIYYYTKLIS
nr:MAG TPA: hypothetical protein [Caudoviricetes sp.]